MSVAWIRNLGGGLAEVMFGLSDGTRQRVVLSDRFVTPADVMLTAQALDVLLTMHAVGR